MGEPISAERFDELFDNGEDISAYVDWSSAYRINEEPLSVKMDFPTWIVRALDAQAQTRGMTREALIARWVVDQLAADKAEPAALP